MKRLLLSVFFILLITPNVKADDIRDFEIQGISIGDSLLEHLNKDFIKKKSSYVKINKKKFKEYKKIYKDKDNKLYDRIALYYKSDDQNYTITRLIGRKYFKKNINDCYNLQNSITNDLEMTLTNPDRFQTGKIKQSKYPNGESYLNEIYFYLKNNALIRIICYDYSKKDTRSKDRLSVILTSGEYISWLRSLK